VNDHDKAQHPAQQSEHARELPGLLNLLETVDRQITPEHVTQRFRKLLIDGIRDHLAMQEALAVSAEPRSASTARTLEAEPLLTPAEVATMFRVDPKTISRWTKAGKLTSIRTLG
jgi:hypothetical protein